MANIVYSFPFPTQLENLLPPVNPTDAATKSYVDSQTANTTPGGANTELQFNANGALGGITGVTSNGTSITMSNANISITGGNTGQFLRTDGNGVLSWATASGGNSTPGGNNTQLQFNANGVFGGITGVTSDGLSLTTSNSNIKITGGSLNQVLVTDGTGNLSWQNQTSGNLGGLVVPAVYFVAPTTGNNQSFNSPILYGYNSNTEMTVYYNGALLENTLYTLTGNALTVNTVLQAGDTIDVITTFVPASVTAVPAVYFVAPANGNNQQFTDGTLSAYKNSNSSMTVFYNGSLLENSLYVLSGNTLTVNTELNAGDTIDIITSAVAGANIAPFNTAAGGNTQIQYNDGGRLGASPGLTYDSANSRFNVIGDGRFGNSSVTIQQGAVSIRSNGGSEYALTVGNASGTGDILAVATTTGAGNGITVDVVDSTQANYAPLTINSNSISIQTDSVAGPELSVIGNMVTAKNFTAQQLVNLGAVGNVKVTGGSAGQVLSTDGNGNLSWTSSAAGSNTQVQFNANGALGAESNFTYDYANNRLNVDRLSTISTTTISLTASDITVDNLIANANADISIGNATTGNILVGGINTNTVGLTSTTLEVVSENANISANITNISSNTTVITGNVNMASSPNIVLSDVANVHITGGINGYVLQTDGLGNLTWTAQSGNGGGSNGAPGGANSQVQFNNAGTFEGNTNFRYDASTSTVIATNLQILGNATFGNVAVSNSLVGNLTGTILTPSQTNITDVGRLNSLQVGNNTSNVTISSSGITMPITTNSYVGSLFIQGNQAVLPTAANLTIPGGNVNQVLTSTGNGGVIWDFPQKLQPCTILTATAIPPGTNTILLDVVKNDLALTQFVNQFRGWVPGGVYRIEMSFSTAQVLGNVEARFNAWCSFSTSSTISSWVQPGQGVVASAPHEGTRIPIGDYLTGTAIGYYVAPPSNGVLYATSFLEYLGTTVAANGTVTIIVTRLA